MIHIEETHSKILRYIVDNKSNNCIPPTGINNRVYFAILDELEADGYIHVAWQEGHEPVDIYVYDKGYAAVELMEKQRREKLMYLFRENKIDIVSYKVLCNLANPDRFREDILQFKKEDDYDDIFEELRHNGYVAYGETKDDNDRITYKGKKLVRLIEDVISDNNDPVELGSTISETNQETWDKYIHKDESHQLFFETLAPFNILNAPKIASLNEDNRKRLFDKIIDSNVDERVALLFVIEILEYFNNTYYMYKESCYALLSEALNCSQQSIKQNFCGCNPQSKMIDPKYNAKNLINMAKKFYVSISTNN